MNMQILNEIVNLTEENANLFAEMADVKAKLLDTQVELNAAIDFINEDVLEQHRPPDELIEVHVYHHLPEDESC
jgi:hypothetical protein